METKEFFKNRYNLSELTTEDCNKNFMEFLAIDSIGLIVLIGDLEDNFGIRFTDEDFKQEDFKTIHGIEKLIISKKQN